MISYFLIVSIFVLVIGSCIGSFLNVVALRAISGESIVLPASKCPKCNSPIKWYDNIPVFSYFFTFKGKCRSCGEKVSIQYPIVEALTALIFLAVYLFFGISIQSILLLIILCLAEVIIITDLKEGVIFDCHSMPLIIVSVIYSLLRFGFKNFSIVIIGLIAGTVIMELLAKLSYFLIAKKKKEIEPANSDSASDDTPEPEKNEKAETDDKEMSIEEYVEKNKRAFGEGDTMLAAAAGALLGCKYFILTLFGSILLQTLCIFPQFLKNIYEKNEKKLLFSLCAFFIFAVVYFVLSNMYNLNVYVIAGMVVILVIFAIDALRRLKSFKSDGEFTPIPFGPPLLITTFIFLFAGKYIGHWVIKHVLFFAG